jgi:hypothetical protein
LEEKRIAEEQKKRMAEELEKAKEQERAHDKGKGTLIITTLVASPMQIESSREVGTSSSSMDPEVKDMFNLQQAQIASLVEAG